MLPSYQQLPKLHHSDQSSAPPKGIGRIPTHSKVEGQHLDQQITPLSITRLQTTSNNSHAQNNIQVALVIYGIATGVLLLLGAMIMFLGSHLCKPVALMPLGGALMLSAFLFAGLFFYTLKFKKNSVEQISRSQLEIPAVTESDITLQQEQKQKVGLMTKAYDQLKAVRWDLVVLIAASIFILAIGAGLIYATLTTCKRYLELKPLLFAMAGLTALGACAIAGFVVREVFKEPQEVNPKESSASRSISGPLPNGPGSEDGDPASVHCFGAPYASVRNLEQRERSRARAKGAASPLRGAESPTESFVEGSTFGHTLQDILAQQRLQARAQPNLRRGSDALGGGLPPRFTRRSSHAAGSGLPPPYPTPYRRGSALPVSGVERSSRRVSISVDPQQTDSFVADSPLGIIPSRSALSPRHQTAIKDAHTAVSILTESQDVSARIDSFTSTAPSARPALTQAYPRLPQNVNESTPPDIRPPETRSTDSPSLMDRHDAFIGPQDLGGNAPSSAPDPQSFRAGSPIRGVSSAGTANQTPKGALTLVQPSSRRQDSGRGSRVQFTDNSSATASTPSAPTAVTPDHP